VRPRLDRTPVRDLRRFVQDEDAAVGKSVFIYSGSGQKKLGIRFQDENLEAKNVPCAMSQCLEQLAD
jgi:hypothetical protein